MKTVSIIVAAAENNAIGRKGDIPWHISEDFKYFKRVTSGHPVVMGYMTWVSLPHKPLPKRENIIISIFPMEQPPYDNVRIVSSLEEALEGAQEEIFVIGGGYTYAQAMQYADRIYLTRVHKTVDDADTFFPEIPENEWKCSRVGEMRHDEESDVDFEFLIYERIR